MNRNHTVIVGNDESSPLGNVKLGNSISAKDSQKTISHQNDNQLSFSDVETGWAFFGIG